MNGKRKTDPNVHCPCYKSNDDHSTYCLGIETADSLGYRWRQPTKLKAFIEEHCLPDDDSKRCLIFPILFRENMGDDG